MRKTALVSSNPINSVTVLSLTSLQKYSDEWLLCCSYQGQSKATIQTRQTFINNFFWFLKQKKFVGCGVGELRQFFHYLQTGHQEVGGRWGNPRLTNPLRPISIKDYYICLSIFFKWLAKEGLLDSSPMLLIDRIQVREEIKHPLTAEQTHALLAAAKISNNARRNEAILLMLFDSGVRASELISLKVQDIDLKSGCFEVIGKGNKKRRCYLGKNTSKALMVYLRKAKLEPQSPLFPSHRGSQRSISRSGLLHLIKRLAKTAGVSANIHQLRRTFATSMLEAGADICSVRDMLGHTNIQMTLKYLAVSQSHIEAQHRQFSPADRLNPKVNQ